MTIFYKKELGKDANSLSEEESKHCFRVLKHQKGDEIRIFDGNGGKHRAILRWVSKTSCEFEIIESKFTPMKSFNIHLAIAPTKNADRMEWLIEKLSEIGVDQISFIQTKHSERKKLRLARLEKKAISAMKQSGNPFLIQVSEPVSMTDFIIGCSSEIKLIAHVDDAHEYVSNQVSPNKSVTILIGPEGDFSLDEVEKATANGFRTISLGSNTLRTETAGFVACCVVNIINRC